MPTPKISVVIPVYKVEKYLPACLDSILAQSFTDFELLLINDGSPDNSGAICDEYAKKDNRIRVFHKKNEGASKTRNFGIDKATGDWIAFVDSDDLLKKDYLLNLYNAIEDDVDLIIAGHERIRENEKIPFVIFKLKEGNLSPLNLLKERKCRYIFATWAKLIRNSTLKEYNIKFDDKISAFEDVIFYLEFICKAKNIKLISSEDYIYINREGTLASRKYNFEVMYKLTHLRKKALYLEILNNYIPQDVQELLEFSISEAIKSLYTKPHLLQRAERLEKLKLIYENEALIIDDMPDKSIFKRFRGNLPILDRVLYSRYNGILSIFLKVKNKLRSLKSLFSKKKKSTQITEI